MLKLSRQQIVLTVGAAVGALALGAGAALVYFSELGDRFSWLNLNADGATRLQTSDAEASQVLALVNQPIAQRQPTLQLIAAGAESGDRHRARYLLASDLIAQNKAGSAIPLLEGLAQEYPVLAAPSLAKLAQAYAAAGNSNQANQTWKTLVERHPNDPAGAEALFALGRSDRKQWDQLLAKFPAHPRSLEVARTKLKENSNQPALLLLLARHGVSQPDITSILDRLTVEYAAQLKPEDWEAIAFAYWENQRYGNAGSAYARAPRTSLNVYRAGRGLHLSEQATAAIPFYTQVVQQFPDSDEAGLALVRLAAIAPKPEIAIQYLDQVIARYPDRAPEALLKKSQTLDALNSPESASKARQQLLSQYSKSDTAAELRWELAEQRFAAGDINGAWTIARQLVSENPNSEYAPEAAFWVGKWAQQLGQQQDAKTSFEYVLTHYPESYYAWRSASLLGLDVGDFTTVREKQPEVVKPTQRPDLPAGSQTLQELYRLGQDREAWAHWQVEFQSFMQPSVVEQFTDGVMRLGVGDNLNGIFMISSLRNREKAEDRSAYQDLKQQISYWQALYPFPYIGQINKWAKERKLNPMLVTGLIRQESRFEPKIESSAGALGLMQVMPGTADWISEQIGVQSFQMTNPEDNIKFGTWYLDYTHREYSNNSLFAVASYNAGPGNIADWIDRFGFRDPDVFVEQIPFPETKGYVESVFGNYWNYLRLYNPKVSEMLDKYSPEHARIGG
ncbi:transglycosylase SLT domain-containing protein [Microcoleus sp. FACHB-1515]|uniref:lytic transglycosylase domain-containing protein n=1 Tax=Cyanophyceae TaxID=3028117 RepID=UPI0016875225|nr:transglycosylase SLT domain-containing protein [Microcoleus sp. FACHB-1515]MBD2090245.1 transglycosylase SLT domain-containing protein [Microcoleus sp. FACHB-1515]